MSVSTNRVSDLEQPSVEAYQAAAAPLVDIGDEAVEASSPFVGQWRTLVSTTNWEKGRLVCQWRDSLEKSGAKAAEFSDEAWAQLVGGVTGQHVGRLRRVFQRFGEVYGEYQGLYWSHFQAASDWEDAEMWLEGALQNGWSVSQTRAKRWETVGDGKPDPLAAEPAIDEVMEEGPSPTGQVGIDPVARESTGASTQVREASEEANEESSAVDSSEGVEDAPFDDEAATTQEPTRPFADLPELPDDVADAFEQFKLVILNHKLAGWEEVSRADVVGVLESLKQLAQAPSDND